MPQNSPSQLAGDNEGDDAAEDHEEYEGSDASQNHAPNEDSESELESDSDSEGDSEPEETYEIKAELDEYLKEVEGTGLIAYYEQFKDMPNPGLVFAGSELLAFPLSRYQYAFIQHNNVQQPVMPVLEGVAPSIMVDRSHLKVVNPAWNTRLSSLPKTIQTMMGITNGISVAVSSFILYGSGSAVQHPVE